jgi:hypothetical protein
MGKYFPDVLCLVVLTRFARGAVRLLVSSCAFVLGFLIVCCRVPVGLIVCLAFEVLLCAGVSAWRVANVLILSARLPLYLLIGLAPPCVGISVLLWLVYACLAGVHILWPRSVGSSRMF